MFHYILHRVFRTHSLTCKKADRPIVATKDETIAANPASLHVGQPQMATGQSTGGAFTAWSLVAMVSAIG
jgi:hypothetical protein